MRKSLLEAGVGLPYRGWHHGRHGCDCLGTSQDTEERPRACAGGAPISDAKRRKRPEKIVASVLEHSK